MCQILLTRNERLECLDELTSLEVSTKMRIVLANKYLEYKKILSLIRSGHNKLTQLFLSGCVC